MQQDVEREHKAAAPAREVELLSVQSQVTKSQEEARARASREQQQMRDQRLTLGCITFDALLDLPVRFYINVEESATVRTIVPARARPPGCCASHS